MGDARRRKNLAQLQGDALQLAVSQTSLALRKLALAASASLGGDCYTHAVLGQLLLSDLVGDLGLSFDLCVGAAAWRVGSGDGDVIAHTPAAKGYLPAGTKGFAYHAWLESSEWLIDFTTYQLTRKAAELDAADGGVTRVDWCPDFLLLRRDQVQSYAAVARAPGPGVAFYESVPELAVRMAQGYTVDEQDLAAARLILKHPDAQVLGPNQVGEA